MARVGAIDCGTNSIRLLIADVQDGGLSDVVREMKIVRLGQGVDATGALAPEALERTFAAAEDYAVQLRSQRVESLRFVATSATRDAANRQVFVDGIRDRLGVEPEVISGREEAELSFTGAASVLAPTPGEKVLVVDLGGGSTEFVLGTADGVLAALSTDMGCVRFTERYLRSDPPTAAEIAEAVADAEQHLAARAGRGAAGRRRPVGRSGRVRHHHHRTRLAAGPVPSRSDPRGTPRGGPSWMPPAPPCWR